VLEFTKNQLSGERMTIILKNEVLNKSQIFLSLRGSFNLPMRFVSIFLFVFILFYANLLLAKAPVFKEKDYYNHPPRIIRTCCAFGTDLKLSILPGLKKTDLTSIELMGKHHYLGHHSEKNGILYTRRGGFIDFGHLRDLVDWTAYIYNLAKKSQERGEIFLSLGFESGEKALMIKVPATEKEEDLVILAGRIAYDLSIWHEITSWFGASAVPLLSEKFSSFSLEDTFSNLLGTKIAAAAILSDLPYDEAVTAIIHQTLIDLEAVSSIEESYQVMESVREIWWTRKVPLPGNGIMIQRKLGAYSTMSPLLAPGWESKNQTPFQLSLPERTSDNIPLSEFYTISVDANNKVPIRKIFPERRDRMVTQNDFQVIIDYISACMIKTNLLL
jgi:hypothetical protein